MIFPSRMFFQPTIADVLSLSWWASSIAWWVFILLHWYVCFSKSSWRRASLTADCVSPRPTRSILQQLFYGLVFPSYSQAGKETPRLRGHWLFFTGPWPLTLTTPVSSRVCGRGHTGRHVQGELHHGADAVLLRQRREVLLRGAGLRELLQVSPPFSAFSPPIPIFRYFCLEISLSSLVLSLWIMGISIFKIEIPVLVSVFQPQNNSVWALKY